MTSSMPPPLKRQENNNANELQMRSDVIELQTRQGRSDQRLGGASRASDLGGVVEWPEASFPLPSSDFHPEASDVMQSCSESKECSVLVMSPADSPLDMYTAEDTACGFSSGKSQEKKKHIRHDTAAQTLPSRG